MNAKPILIAAAILASTPPQSATAAAPELFVSCASATMPDRTEVALFLDAGSFGVEEQRDGLIRAAHRACRDGASAVRFVRADAGDAQAAARAPLRAVALREQH